MRPELETYHQIDRYFRGELQGEELRTFESEIESNSALKEELDFQQLVNQVVRGSASDQLRERMSIDIKKLDRKKSFQKYGIIGGATFALLLSAIGYFNLRKTDLKVEEIRTNESIVSKSNQNEPQSLDDKIEIEQNQVIVNKRVTSFSTLNKIQKENKKSLELEEVQIANSVSVNPQKDLQPTIEKLEVAEVHSLPVKPIISDPCAGITITAFPKVYPTCAGTAEGKVLYAETEISGGVGPYSIKLAKSSNFKEAYYNLDAGKHDFRIVDSKGCEQILSVVVPEKNCKENKFTFNPDNGELWKVPTDMHSGFLLTIHNKRGEIVFKRQLKNEFEWNGTDNNGVMLESGMYLYVLEYSEGNKENGQITIIR